MDTLVHFFINLFGGLNKDVIIFIISLMPILELRGGMLAATLLHIDFIKALIICIVGNLLPIPVILIFLDYVLKILEKWKVTAKVVRWLEKKVDSKRGQIDKYGYLGLVLFVGIPLPGTGAWTGTLLAIMLGLDKKKSFISILIGVFMASIIMSIISYGVLGNLL
jgi:uncharacterized membrane protein